MVKAAISYTINSHGLRSPNYAEFGHFMLLFHRGWLGNISNMKDCV